jgi:NDP-sugar pyrophosphorylase family protein
MLTPADYFDLSHPDVARLFARHARVWGLLAELPELVADLLGGRRIIKGRVMPGVTLDDGPLYIGEGATLEPGSYVKGPAYLGSSVVIRQGAYVREDCILLDGSLLGHASEVKNSVLLPGAKAPHFAYVGDSVLGHRVNLGAGVKLSNAPISPRRTSDGRRPTITIDVDGEVIDTGLRKLGAIVGDDVMVGCNVVFNPGALIGPRSLVYPNATVAKGVHPADSIVKLRQNLTVSPRV